MLFLHYILVFCTSDPLGTLCVCPAERLLLLFEEEVRLVRGQAAEVSSYRKVEAQLPGSAQTRLSEGQQLTVGSLLASSWSRALRRFSNRSRVPRSQQHEGGQRVELLLRWSSHNLRASVTASGGPGALLGLTGRNHAWTS
ncbi:hypothetical protein EYF80_029603 [Liparis tanakae]|uniref:Uncharacterized protein n=1 Tax=Liparis tanakae TaxID=230148 RepID=A0A4Z2H3Y0_9TELE|nr:hypothetical protein EYF80_029603 [Liparis tanakae]